jgi:hypothetical protein
MSKPTMTQLSYGIAKPVDLLKKLNQDEAKLTAKPHPHDVFNFVVTAAVLNEWIRKCYLNPASPKNQPTSQAFYTRIL